MSNTTNNLQLIIPEVPGANPSESFDWEEFIRNNFVKVDNMPILGGTHIVNAAEFITNGYFDMSALLTDTVVSTYLYDGVFIYFTPGIYNIYDGASSAGMDIGINEVPAAVTLFGAKGAIISSNTAAGDAVTYMLRLRNLTDVTIVGLTFVGRAGVVSSCATVGIQAEHVERLHINDVTIHDIAYGIVLDENAGGNETEKVWIENCTVYDFLKDGIIGDEVKDLYINNNYVNYNPSIGWPAQETSGDGISIKVGTGTEMAQVGIVDNTIISTRRNGIKLLDNVDAGEAPAHIVVRGNTIDSPGNFQDETTETTKSTRGSGIYSEFQGVLHIINNSIKEPLSHGIYSKNAGELILLNNRVKMAYERPADTDDSWHGVYVETTTKPVISGNQVDIKRLASATYGGEDRYGIYINDCDNAQFTNNNCTCRCYVYSSDDMTITGNNIDGSVGNWTSNDLIVKGEINNTSDKCLISNNRAALGIQIIGDTYAGESAKVIGNTGSLSWAGGAGACEDESDTRIQAFNTYDPAGETDLITHPKFRIDLNGIIQHGRYSEVHWLPATEWYPDGVQCKLEFVESLTPALTFDGTGVDAAAYYNMFVTRYDFNDPVMSGITVEVLYSTASGVPGGTAAIMNLGYYFTQTDTGSCKGFSYTDIGSVSIGQTDLVEKIKFTIPHAALGVTKPVLFLKLWRDVDNGNDDLLEDVQVFGVRLSWRAVYDGYMPEMV